MQPFAAPPPPHSLRTHPVANSPLQSSSGLDQWIVRRSTKHLSNNNPDTLGRVENFVRCGDVVLLESLR